MSVAESTAPHDMEIFDGKEYEVPFAKVEGKEVNELALRLGGVLKLNRNDTDHVALIESLALGRMMTLTVTASVADKGQSVREGVDGTETVTYSVGLKIHEVMA